MSYGFDSYSFAGYRQSETCGTIKTGCGGICGGTEIIVHKVIK